MWFFELYDIFVPQLHQQIGLGIHHFYQLPLFDKILLPNLLKPQYLHRLYNPYSLQKNRPYS